MKVLFVGASGVIGGGILDRCLAHPDITSVVAFVRRELSSAASANSKVKWIIKKDFARWEDDELRPHTDAAAMIWAMGTSSGDVDVNLEYPVTFQESFVRILEQSPERPRFRFVLLSGKFVVQDQDKGLWFLDAPRKIKGQLITKTLALAKEHPSRWQAYLARPGGVVSKGMIGRGVVMGAFGAVLGKNWSITVEELGASMAELAANGGENDGLIENADLVERGRALLKAQGQLEAAT